jgi:CubicO group peptidase (beta-lactamase class C family)
VLRRATLTVLAFLASAPLIGAETKFPGATWDRPGLNAPEGWSSDKLRQAEVLFQANRSTAVMVVHNGHVVAAWGDVARTVNVWSVKTSLVGALYGIGVAEARIDLNRTLADLGIYDNEPRLTTSEREATVRDLLMMRSGICHGAVFEPPGATRPVRGSKEPGESWHYNAWDLNVLGTIYTRFTRETIFEAFDKRIARAIGMEDYRPERDGHFFHDSVSHHPAYIMFLSARDLARFGLLYLNDGMWAGQQVVPSSWVAESTKQWSDTSSGLGYGYMWWHLPSVLGLGGDGFAALGYRGQAVLVIPSKRLVVTQTADRTDSLIDLTASHLFELVRLIVAASPSKSNF